MECTEVNGFQLLSPVGNISLTHPNEVHANPNINDASYSFVTYYLSPDFVKHVLKVENFGFKERVVDNKALFRTLFQWATSKELQDQLPLVPVLDELMRDYFVDHSEEEFPENKIKHLSEVLAYMEHRYQEKISLETLARMAGQNKYAFLRAFKKIKGVTPANYLILKRLESAKHLLKSGYSIVDATYECGFFDQSHFNKYFKKYHGLTPQQYQKGTIRET